MLQREFSDFLLLRVELAVWFWEGSHGLVNFPTCTLLAMLKRFSGVGVVVQERHALLSS